MKYASFALVASFATTIVALPYVAERDVVVVTKTDVHVDQVEVTKFVTAGAPDATTAVTVTASAPSSSAEQHEHRPHGQNHWSISHSDSASPAPVVISTTAPAPPPPAPTTTTPATTAPATTAAPVTTPKVTTSDAPKAPAPAANNPGTKTAGMSYTTPVNPYPSPSPVSKDGDDSYNPWDGNLQQNSLDAHNAVRAKYQAKPVVWNYTLEQEIINVNMNKNGLECVFEHSPGDYGQNIAAQTGGNVQGMVDMWSSEVKDVKFNGQESGLTNAGHFTAMVWQETTSIACGAIKCGDGGSWANKDHRNPDNNQPDFWNGWFYECNYYPTGNVQGAYVKNVLGPK